MEMGLWKEYQAWIEVGSALVWAEPVVSEGLDIRNLGKKFIPESQL